MIKKILLVNPSRFVYKVNCIPPFVLGYLASWVKRHNGVQVKITDEALGGDVAKDIESFSPDLVGIGAMTDFVIRGYEIAEIAKRRGILTVMGGKHATVLPQEVSEHCDIVVKGPGELALSEIIDGRRDRIIDGRSIEDLDLIPPVPWELFKMSSYLINYRTTHPFANVFWPSNLGFIMTSRGCPYSCIFCYNSSGNEKMRFMSPQRVLEDITQLKNRYNISSLCFVDDNLFSNKKNLKILCELMIKNRLNLKWVGGATVNYVSEEILALAQEAGCVQISFGFESGNQRILNLLKKNKFTIEDNRRAIRLCKKMGIKIWGSFIIGTPTETKEEIRDTIDFIKANALDSVNLQIAKPYPGTELWELCVERKTIPEGFSWDSYDKASFSDLFSYQELCDFMIEAVDSTNKYTFSRAIERIRHEPAVILRIFYDLRFLKIIKRIFLNFFSRKARLR